MIQTKAVGGSPGYDPSAPAAPVPTAAPRPGYTNEPKPVLHTPGNIGVALADRPNPGIGWIH